MMVYVSLPVHYIITYTYSIIVSISTYHIPGLDYIQKHFFERPVYNKENNYVSFYQSSNQMCV